MTTTITTSQSPTSDLNPRLPPEIIDIIIDILNDSDDTLALCSFSLVSSQFLSSCRRRLHYFVNMGAEDCINQRKITNFVQFLRESPNVGPFVRKVFIVRCMGSHPARGEEGKMTVGLFGEMLRLVPNLIWVGLSGVQFRERFDLLSLPSVQQTQLQQQQLRYTYLYRLLLDATKWEILELLRFLSLFSHIGTLNAKGVSALDHFEAGTGGGAGDGGIGGAAIVAGQDNRDVYLACIDSLASSLVSHLTVDRYATSPRDLPLIPQVMRHVANAETVQAFAVIR